MSQVLARINTCRIGLADLGAQGHCTLLFAALSPVATEALAENPVGAKPEP